MDTNTLIDYHDPTVSEIEHDVVSLLRDAEEKGLRIPRIELNYRDFYIFSEVAFRTQYVDSSNRRSFIYHSPYGEVQIEPSRDAPPRRRTFSHLESQSHPLYKILKGRKKVIDSDVSF